MSDLIEKLSCEQAKELPLQNSSLQNPTIFPTMAKVRLVPEETRLDCLPSIFGKDYVQMQRFENGVYDVAGMLCSEYQGGLWHYATVSYYDVEFETDVEVFFMYPDESGFLRCANAMNWAEGVMDAKSFGFLCTLLSYYWLETKLGYEKGNDLQQWLIEEVYEVGETPKQIIENRRFYREIMQFID